jgi:hypothetical protein
VGHAFDHDNQARANRIALGYCGRVASHCRVAVSFTDQCGAIAETKVGDVSHGLGATKRDAEAPDSLPRLHRKNMQGCHFDLLRKVKREENG